LTLDELFRVEVHRIARAAPAVGDCVQDRLGIVIGEDKVKSIAALWIGLQIIQKVMAPIG
jgi:hypothetical protein